MERPLRASASSPRDQHELGAQVALQQHFSAARAEMLAYLFPTPTRADTARALGKEAGDSRIWAGIHYPMDNVAGVNLGHSVAALFIDWAKHDGSQ